MYKWTEIFTIPLLFALRAVFIPFFLILNRCTLFHYAQRWHIFFFYSLQMLKDKKCLFFYLSYFDTLKKCGILCWLSDFYVKKNNSHLFTLFTNRKVISIMIEQSLTAVKQSKIRLQHSADRKWEYISLVMDWQHIKDWHKNAGHPESFPQFWWKLIASLYCLLYPHEPFEQLCKH